MNKKRIGLFAVVFTLLISSVFAKSDAAAGFSAGKKLQQQEDWYGAIEQYLEVVRLNPSYGDAWFALAECSYETGEYELALSYIEKAEAFLKNKPEIQNLSGFCYIGLGNTEAAQKTFEQVLKKFPNNVEARFGLAELDILSGRINGAEKQYLSAFQRQNRNCRILLSLALVSEELGKKEAVKEYLNQAMRYFSGNPEVYYFAAYLAKKENQLKDAEEYIQTAIQLNPDYDLSYKMLSDILFEQGNYEEVLKLCKFRTKRNRNAENVWYLKGLALTELGRIEEAFTAYETGLSIEPQDEVMRSALELLAVKYTDIEDVRRSKWADYHIKKAAEYSEKYYSVQAAYEYQRALRLNPLDSNVRLAYANILLSDGYPEAYLSNLLFIQSQDTDLNKLADTVESYSSLLYDTLPKKWDTDPFYLDKSRWRIGFFYQKSETGVIHPDCEEITSGIFADIFSVSSAVKIELNNKKPVSFTEAFSKARAEKYDYFCIVKADENEREVTLYCDMYSGRTGNLAANWQVYRTGNNRYSGALQKMRSNVLSSLPYYAVIKQRKGTAALIDAGRMNGVKTGQVWTIIEKGALKTADKGLALAWQEDKVLGSFTVTAAGEEISEGEIKQKGFYDRVNAGDVLVLQLNDSEQKKDSVKSDSVQEPGTKRQEPYLLRMLRLIR